MNDCSAMDVLNQFCVVLRGLTSNCDEITGPLVFLSRYDANGRDTTCRQSLRPFRGFIKQQHRPIDRSQLIVLKRFGNPRRKIVKRLPWAACIGSNGQTLKTRKSFPGFVQQSHFVSASFAFVTLHATISVATLRQRFAASHFIDCKREFYSVSLFRSN